jgi:hypothetical protein
MKTVLIVRRDFGDFKRGMRIEDAAVVEKLKKSHPHHVVVSTVPDSSRFTASVH